MHENERIWAQGPWLSPRRMDLYNKWQGGQHVEVTQGLVKMDCLFQEWLHVVAPGLQWDRSRSALLGRQDYDGYLPDEKAVEAIRQQLVEGLARRRGEWASVTLPDVVNPSLELEAATFVHAERKTLEGAPDFAKGERVREAREQMGMTAADIKSVAAFLGRDALETWNGLVEWRGARQAAKEVVAELRTEGSSAGAGGQMSLAGVLARSLKSGSAKERPDGCSAHAWRWLQNHSRASKEADAKGADRTVERPLDRNPTRELIPPSRQREADRKPTQQMTQDQLRGLQLKGRFGVPPPPPPEALLGDGAAIEARRALAAVSVDAAAGRQPKQTSSEPVFANLLASVPTQSAQPRKATNAVRLDTRRNPEVAEVLARAEHAERSGKRGPGSASPGKADSFLNRVLAEVKKVEEAKAKAEARAINKLEAAPPRLFKRDEKEKGRER